MLKLMRGCLLLFAILVLAGCGGPRGDSVPRGYALQWYDPMTVKIIKTWDMVIYHKDVDPQVSHLIEVKVLEGPSQYVGQELMLPFDKWAVGVSEPPPRGTIQTIAPAQWVRPNPNSRGAPAPGWGRGQ